MPTFTVVYKDSNGDTVRGRKASGSREAILADLRSSGFVPISVAPADVRPDQQEGQRAPARRRRRGRIKLSETALAFRTLATMLGGGLPIMDCLVDIAEQSDSTRFRKILLAVTANVRKGRMLSSAMADYPEAFSPLVCALVEAGEESGNLTKVLTQLSQYLESQLDLRRKIKVSTIYPAFIVSFFVVALAVVVFFVLPKFKTIFDSVDTELPTLTRIVMSVSDVMTRHVLYALPCLVAAVIGFLFWRKTSSGRRIIDTVLLRAPIIGKLVSQIVIARLTRTLSLLIDSGITVVEALKLAARVAGNTLISEQLEEVRRDILRGGHLSDQLASRRCFPRMMVRMTAAGEASGRLGDMLNRVAIHFTRESTARIDGLMAMLEPALLVVVGVLVGIVVIAVYFPIFNLARSIS